MTFPKYGPFNSPWGNPSFDPFFGGHQNYVHNGVDYECAPGTPVKAACSGTIKKVGDLGFDTVAGTTYWWGKYALHECIVNGSKVTLAYDHLATAGLVVQGADVALGQALGAVYDLSYPGEKDHLHFGVCAGDFSACNGVAQAGAAPDTQFAGLMINADAPAIYQP